MRSFSLWIRLTPRGKLPVMVSVYASLAAFTLLWTVPATALAESSPPEFSDESGIEVEAMVPIVEGDAVRARNNALSQAFGEIVTIAAEAHMGIGSMARRPGLAKRLRRDAMDYLDGYQILTDLYQLEEAPEEEPAELPLEWEEGAPRRVIPANHYLVRVRGWVHRERLFSALGMVEGAVADLAVTLRDVSRERGAFSQGRLDRLQEALIGILGGEGWGVAEGPEVVARRRLHVEVDGHRPRVMGEGVEEVAVKLTARLAEPEGRVSAILQVRGASTFSNLDFAWAEAERKASAELAVQLREVFPPPSGGRMILEQGEWMDLAISPLPRYEWGLELEEAILNGVEGVVRVDRIGYAGRRFRLRLLFDGSPQSLADRLETLHWRDFNLRVVDRSAAVLEIRLQRF